MVNYPSEKLWQSRDRTPTDRQSAPQGYQRKISGSTWWGFFLARKRIPTRVLWSINNLEVFIIMKSGAPLLGLAKSIYYFALIRWQKYTRQFLLEKNYHTSSNRKQMNVWCQNLGSTVECTVMRKNYIAFAIQCKGCHCGIVPATGWICFYLIWFCYYFSVLFWQKPAWCVLSVL